MKSDIEIAQEARLRPIEQIAADLGVAPDDVIPYGRDKAKIDIRAVERAANRPDAPLVLVSAVTPTPAGEGKSTTTVGLGQALCRLGKRAVVALREPSLGPCFGVKGGAAGGGWSQVVPMEDINLHFTGDFPAITAAHNLLSAMLDNHLHHGNELALDSRDIAFRRVLDMNDRALRDITVGLGGKINGVPRETGFDITVASEVMAILCLARDRRDLKDRCASIVVGYRRDGAPVRARDLKAEGAMAVLLKDAIHPNLVQTLEGTPALVHGGPFANIAHGCNSILATKVALKYGEIAVTEAGFGFDLGGEKFLDIKCAYADCWPSVVVLVATVRALKMHGGAPKAALAEEDLAALSQGMVNLEKHLENVRIFGLPVVVAINRFPTDSPAEIAHLRRRCEELRVPVALSEVFEKGGAGGEELARMVLSEIAQGTADYRPLYPWDRPLTEKIEIVARRLYGASGVTYSKEARKRLELYESLGYGNLPVNMAKTPYSFSDDARAGGRPAPFTLAVDRALLSAGAGFVVAVCGDIMTMPGLPRRPAAETIDIDLEGRVSGLF
ncbi:MAG TPA: formate--tetrahydrofolate ligase [Thermoanaerobaculia bacterium]|jgi:formate--tetrahydrofolate ligase